MGSRCPHLLVDIAVLFLTTGSVLPAFASKVSISSLPVLSSSVLVADDTTQYTVTLTASSVAGYNDITSVRILFNMTESGPDTNNGRGYMAWGATDADITNYGGSWVFADATGGGRWAYRTDTWGGTTYITPLGCSVSTAGAATGATGARTVTLTFTLKPAWAHNPVFNVADGRRRGSGRLRSLSRHVSAAPPSHRTTLTVRMRSWTAIRMSTQRTSPSSWAVSAVPTRRRSKTARTDEHLALCGPFRTNPGTVRLGL